MDHPPESIPPGKVDFKDAIGKYVCTVCGYVCDPEVGDPEHGIPPETHFEDLPDDWHCPRCRQSKDIFSRA